MLIVYRSCLGGFLLSLILLGCSNELVDPTENLTATVASGSTLKAPTETRASGVSEIRIDVSWRDNSSNETGFEVHRSRTGLNGAFELWASTGPNVASYSHVGLSASMEVCYKILAFRRSGGKSTYSGFSNTACATTKAPLAPSGVNAKPVRSTRVEITWSDNSSTEAGFQVQRSQDLGSSWVTTGAVDPNVTFFSDYGLPNEQQFCYRVVAVMSQGTSPISTHDCTTRPAPPSNLTATAIDAQTVDLAWADNSAVEEGYEIQRAAAPSLIYEVVANLAPNEDRYRDTGLPGNGTYFYRISATKDGGFSEFSNDASVVLATAPPDASSITSASPASSSVVVVTWVDNSTNTEGFRLERSIDDGASWSPAATTVHETAFTDGDRLSEQQVCYRVTAFNRIGDSPPSNTACTTPPAAPTELAATELDPVTFQLTWNDNSGAEGGYEVHRVFPLGNGESHVIAELSPNSIAYQVTEYCPAPYFVIAKKDGGFSDPSEQVIVGNHNGCW